MIMKVFTLLLIIACFAMAEKSDNWTGWKDTAWIDSFSGTILKYSKKSMSLTDYDMVRLIAEVADTTTAGFASDSVAFQWGYQTFSLCYDSGLTANPDIDTCFSPRVVVDTIKTAYYGSLSTIYTLDANGIAASPMRQVDTTGTPGFAVQSRTFAPEWDTFYRIWVKGLTGNKTGRYLKLLFTQPRRIYRGIRGK